MKKTLFISFICFSILSISITSCGDNTSNKVQKTNKAAKDTTKMESSPLDSALAFNPKDVAEDALFEITTNKGVILIQLYKETPLHRENFIKLASEKFFDSTLFHRVIRDFMIQGGDPLTKDPNNKNAFGTGDPGYTIPAEILTQFTHKKGALCAARKGDAANPKKNSSGSQFYLVHNPEHCIHLDGEYTIFGETIDGFDVIDKIAKVKTNERNIPLNDIMIISVRPI